MVKAVCDACSSECEMVKVHGGRGLTWKLPWNWMTTKLGIACTIPCYQKLKEKGKKS